MLDARGFELEDRGTKHNQNEQFFVECNLAPDDTRTTSYFLKSFRNPSIESSQRKRANTGRRCTAKVLHAGGVAGATQKVVADLGILQPTYGAKRSDLFVRNPAAEGGAVCFRAMKNLRISKLPSPLTVQPATRKGSKLTR